jgi:hypothetical protein
VPTATATPSQLLTARQPEVVHKQLTEAALLHLRKLSDELGPRTSASPREETAAQYIADELRRSGYTVSIQEFGVRLPPGQGKDLTLTSPELRKVATYAMAGAAEGEVSGRLVYVGLGGSADIPSSGLAGAIAVARRGVLQFSEKAANVSRAGAVGLVVINNEPGLFRGNLGEGAGIPAVGISDADGEALMRLIESGRVEASLSVRTEERRSRNVLATLGAGTGPVVVLGGHFDSVPESPGANDNASGIAVLLAMASEMVKAPPPVEVRIVAFGSEEIGLLGSRHYVESLGPVESRRLAAMLNFDALGAGMLAVIGDAPLVNEAVRAASAISVPVVESKEPEGASSDHASFRVIGVPVLFFAGTDFSKIHTPEDTLESVNPALLGQAAALGLAVLNEVAKQVAASK